MTPEELRARREALGLSQSDLARPLGVPPLTVWKWEHARQKAPAIMEMAVRGVGSLRDAESSGAGYFRSNSLSAAVVSSQRISSFSRDRLSALDFISSTFQLSGCWFSS